MTHPSFTSAPGAPFGAQVEAAAPPAPHLEDRKDPGGGGLGEGDGLRGVQRQGAPGLGVLEGEEDQGLDGVARGDLDVRPVETDRGDHLGGEVPGEVEGEPVEGLAVEGLGRTLHRPDEEGAGHPSSSTG